MNSSFCPHLPTPLFHICWGRTIPSTPWSHLCCLALPGIPQAGRPKSAGSTFLHSTSGHLSSPTCFCISFHLHFWKFSAALPASSPQSPRPIHMLSFYPEFSKTQIRSVTPQLEALSLLCNPLKYDPLSEQQSSQDHHLSDFLSPSNPQC